MIGDILHTKHLGSDSYFAGGLLRLLTHHSGGTPDYQLKSLICEIREDQRLHRTGYPLKFLSHSMIQKSDARTPQLTGTRGLIIRDLMPTLLRIFRRKARDIPPHRDILTGLEMSIRIDEILFENSLCYRLPPAAAAELLNCGFAFCECVVALVCFYRGFGIGSFNFTIKAHQLIHLCLQGQYCNPLAGSCYGGEELMQSCRRLIQVCAHGNSLEKATNVAMCKYLRGVGLQWEVGSQFR